MSLPDPYSVSESLHSNDRCLEIPEETVKARDKTAPVGIQSRGLLDSDSEAWLDSYGFSFALFILFIGNATVFLIWLIILSSHKDFISNHVPFATPTAIAEHCILGGSVFINCILARIAKLYLCSDVLTVASGIFAVIWCAIAVASKS